MRISLRDLTAQTPRRYHRVTIVALVLLVVIVVSGAAVRLTGSGLGCDDWPNCNDQRFVDVSTGHAAIEQVNRLFTGLVSAGVIAAVLGAWWLTPRRKDLLWLSGGLVAGVLAQAVLGGIVVRVDLHPYAVQGHLLLSMVLVGNAVVLVDRAGRESGPRPARRSPPWRSLVWALGTGTTVAIVTGTVVTGAGPHAGDEDVERLGIDISAAARVHSATVLMTVALAVVLAIRLARRGEATMVRAALSTWIALALLQAALGYAQYFSDVPPLLVGLHVFGATLLWMATVHLVLVAERPPAAVTGGTSPARGLVASRNT
ncbi:MAG: COX15/CtaA family protein [Acidimicrobiia bacterium]|nr:COX15/CtaA family protein [Acidimicrobiia bacterium]